MDPVRTSDPGFAIEPAIFSQAECDAIATLLARMITPRGRAGARHLMRDPAVAALAADPRLLALARDSLGAGAIPFRATLFEKSGQANWLVAWHQDTALPLASSFEAEGWGPWSRKAGILYAHAPGWALSRILALRVHLDASTSDNGPLRVIPGSHSRGVLTDEAVHEYARTHDHADCLAPRGGVLAMRPLLIHSSTKARIGSPRRVLHIEYADSLDLMRNMRLAVA